jgi:hypothetical protein
MPFLRFMVACLSALACLGTSYADAAQRPPRLQGKGSKPAALLRVQICAGKVEQGLCGPKLSGSFPEIAKVGGINSVEGPLTIRCPGKPPQSNICETDAARPVKVTIRAWVIRDGYHHFDHWEGACSGTVQVCTLRVDGVTTAKAVIRSD